MIYWHCPRCRLAIRDFGSRPAPRECPRCRTYSGVSSPLFPSSLNARELRAEHAEEAERERQAPAANGEAR
jgi:hypothetical protein